MSHFHAVVWLDHIHAKVFEFNADAAEENTVAAHQPSHHLKSKAGSSDGKHGHGDKDFYHHVAERLAGAGEILICGPGSAKTELMKHLESHDPRIAKKVAGVETVDHPTDGQIVAHARAFFVKADRMRPQR